MHDPDGCVRRRSPPVRGSRSCPPCRHDVLMVKWVRTFRTTTTAFRADASTGRNPNKCRYSLRSARQHVSLSGSERVAQNRLANPFQHCPVVRRMVAEQRVYQPRSCRGAFQPLEP